jgi:pimeloyl-ACP methyl ester carboxylesterase
LDKRLRPSIPDPALRAFVLTNYDNRRRVWKIPIGTLVKELEAIAGFDIPSSSSYDGDVFIIHGGQSRFVRHAYMDQIRQFFPNHMLTTIRGAGHWVHAEAPDDTIALLKRFLDR